MPPSYLFHLLSLSVSLYFVILFLIIVCVFSLPLQTPFLSSLRSVEVMTLLLLLLLLEHHPSGFSFVCIFTFFPLLFLIFFHIHSFVMFYLVSCFLSFCFSRCSFSSSASPHLLLLFKSSFSYFFLLIFIPLLSHFSFLSYFTTFISVPFCLFLFSKF